MGSLAMKNGDFNNRLIAAFAVVACVGLLSINVCLAAKNYDNSSDDQQQNAVTGPYLSPFDEMKSREEASVIEVNEATLAEQKKTEAVKKERYREELGYIPKGNLLSDKELNALEERRAEKEKTIRERFGYEINSLQEQSASAMEQQPASPGQRPEAAPRVPAKTIVPGTVTGIVLCENKGAALVNGRIVRENDVVQGIKVIKVTPDSVAFDKQGKQWTQQVGQAPPASVWDQKSSTPAQQKPPAAPKAKTTR